MLLVRCIILQIFSHCMDFGNISNIHKVEKLHERVIRFIQSDYNADYFTILITQVSVQSMPIGYKSALKYTKSKMC